MAFAQGVALVLECGWIKGLEVAQVIPMSHRGIFNKTHLLSLLSSLTVGGWLGVALTPLVFVAVF